MFLKKFIKIFFILFIIFFVLYIISLKFFIKDEKKITNNENEDIIYNSNLIENVEYTTRDADGMNIL